MAEADQIILRIALAGQDDVIARLGEIGQAGEGAMAKLESAITGGSTAFAGLTAAVAGVGGALFYWANSSSKAIESTANLAAAAGTSISQMSALQQTLSAAGASTDLLGSSFRRLAFTIEAQWSQIVEKTRKSSNEAIDAQLKLKDSSFAVADAEDKLLDTQIKYAQKYRGYQPDPEVEARRQRLKDLRDLEKAENDLAKAKQANIEAQEAEEKRQRNAPETVQSAVEAIAGGRKTFAEANQTADLTLENVIQGVIASAGPAAEKLKNFNGNVGDLITQAPSVKDVFFKISDFMKNSGNDALNTALAYRVLGRGVGQDVVEAMKHGSASLQEYMDHLEKLGLVLTDTDKEKAQSFTKSFNSLSGELTTTIHQIGALFAPTFTQGFDTFRKFIEQNHQQILDFASSVSNRVKPIILDFFDVISGNKAERTSWIQPLVDGLTKAGSFIKQNVLPIFAGLFNAITGGESAPGSSTEKWQQTFEGIGKTLKSVFAGVSEAISAIWHGLETVVTKFNEAFGTKLTAGELVGITLAIKLVDQLTGAFTAAFNAGSKLLGLFTGGAAGGAAGAGLAGILGGAGAKGAAGAAGAGAGALAEGQMGLFETALNFGANNPGALAGGIAVGFAQGIAGAIAKGFAAAVGSTTVIAAIGAAAGALFVLFAEKLKDKQNAEKETIQPTAKRPEVDPLTGIPLRTTEAENIRRAERNAEIYQKQQEDFARGREDLLNKPYNERGTSPFTDNATPVGKLKQKVEDANKQLDEMLYGGISGQDRSDIFGPDGSGGPFGFDRRSGGVGRKDQWLTITGGSSPDSKEAAQTAGEGIAKAFQDYYKSMDNTDFAPGMFGPGTGSSKNKTETLEEYYRGMDNTVPSSMFRSENKPEDEEASQAAAALQQIEQPAQQASSSLEQVGSGAQSLVSSLQSVAQAIEGVAQRISSIQISAPEGSGGGGGESGGVAEAATGGLVYGPGGPTSDTVPAMLSPGEFVVTADGGNLNAAMSHFGRGYALGGLISNFGALMAAPVQHFAAGGPVAALPNPMAQVSHLGTIDLRTNAGTVRAYAARGDVESLKQEAVRQATQRGQVPQTWRR